MFKVRIITLAASLAIGGAALAVAPIASANHPAAAATATDDNNRGQAEPGDDNGGRLAEPANAARATNRGQAEPGDDSAKNVAASAGPTKTKTKKGKRHTHARHASHRLGAR